MTVPSAPRIAVERLPNRLRRDASRMIARFFWPESGQRARALIERVTRLDRETGARLLEQCLRDFEDRYDDLPGILEDHFRRACDRLGLEMDVTPDQRLLIGAYFTMEYAYASAAFFNPSIVPDIRRRGVTEGSTRFIMSLRAVGEGHISSIVFRTGVIGADDTITFDPVPRRSRRLRVVEDRSFDRRVFLSKLIEAGAYTDQAGAVLERVGETFTVSELARAIEESRSTIDLDGVADTMMWLAHSNYQIRAPEGTTLSELVIFPLSENESNGIEDMRLVHFTNDDGTEQYYGTYTAYNGSRILPQIMEMSADRTAKVHTLGGKYAVNKGLALFPRRIDGLYAMLLRFDGVNQYFAVSDNLRFWNDAVLVQAPRYPWEFVQIGNCGSPIETEAGWLVLTHGVGPMRRYCIGASLLDRDDPSKLIGQLAEPLLMPLPEQRGGYVPNVVYSCGGMIHNGRLVIPYGISDVETGFAGVAVADLLGALMP
jgi:predicted GH43/DUF377 family glycosyl hydrolase